MKDECSWSWGGFHNPIHALRQALTLCPKLLCPKKASQKIGVERKMSLRPTFNLYKIDLLMDFLNTICQACAKNTQKKLPV